MGRQAGTRKGASSGVHAPKEPVSTKIKGLDLAPSPSELSSPSYSQRELFSLPYGSSTKKDVTQAVAGIDSLVRAKPLPSNLGRSIDKLTGEKRRDGDDLYIPSKKTRLAKPVPAAPATSLTHCPAQVASPLSKAAAANDQVGAEPTSSSVSSSGETSILPIRLATPLHEVAAVCGEIDTESSSSLSSSRILAQVASPLPVTATRGEISVEEHNEVESCEVENAINFFNQLPTFKSTLSLRDLTAPVLAKMLAAYNAHKDDRNPEGCHDEPLPGLQPSYYKFAGLNAVGEEDSGYESEDKSDEESEDEMFDESAFEVDEAKEFILLAEVDRVTLVCDDLEFDGEFCEFDHADDVSDNGEYPSEFEDDDEDESESLSEVECDVEEYEDDDDEF